MQYLKLFIIITLLTYVCILGIQTREESAPVAGLYPTVGMASWYSARQTASGEKFDPQAATCAMRKSDYGRHYRVCNLANSKCVTVKHNDFGPKKSLYRQGRIIDLNRKAFEEIASAGEGIIRVTVTPESPLNP
jgi:rare lipoprotein A